MLSFSSFGTVRAPETEKINRAVELVRQMKPGMPVDGPIQPDLALDQEAISKIYPFADLRRRPNLLIFPNLDAGNISLRLLRSLSQAKSIGPLIIGLNKPIHLLPRGTEVNNIVNLAAIACVDAQHVEEASLANA